MMSQNKVSLLCRYGGNFGEESGKVSYKDGTNRMMLLGAGEINRPRLLSKLLKVCKWTNIGSIKYKHPELGLDCLVSVENDEDLCNMIQAFETQNNGVIHLFISEAQQTLPLHNTIPSIDKRITVPTVENQGRSKEMPPQNPTEYACANKMLQLPQTMKLEAGQEFPNSNDFNKVLREYAICSNFEYKRTRSEHGCFAAKCIKKDCSWRIQAFQLSEQPTFKIKSLKGKHTCNLDQQFKVSHHQATRKWIADIVEHRNYFQSTPKVIADTVEKEYGIHVGYHKAWRGRELAQKRKNCIGKSRQDDPRNYYNIEKLCEDIRRTNPGSRVKLQSKSTENNHLELLISYEAAVIHVFQTACRPVVRLISVKVKGKRPYVWFTAMGLDTDWRHLLLACGFIELDHEEDPQGGYKWFCSELFHILGGRISNLVFVVEYRHEEGALEVVRAIFPHSHCAYSHLSFLRGISNKFDNLSSYLLRSAKEAWKQSGFDKRMSEMYEQCPEAWEFLRNINPEYWATSHFKGACYDPIFNELDTEEQLQNWIGHHKRDLSIFDLVEHLHNFMTETFTERVERSFGWMTILVPRFETRFPHPFSDVKILESTTTTPPTRFTVSFLGIDGEDVDIHMRNCSCGVWQICGHPCRHAKEVINCFQLNRYEFWDECYKAAQYRKAYALAVIDPLPTRLKKITWVTKMLDIFF